QGAFMDSEVLGDLGDRGLLVAVQGDADDVVAELFRVGLWHGVYPSRLACEQARSDVTKPCISPLTSGKADPCRGTARAIPADRGSGPQGFRLFGRNAQTSRSRGEPHGCASRAVSGRTDHRARSAQSKCNLANRERAGSSRHDGAVDYAILG